jgi:hypothetical protein
MIEIANSVFPYGYLSMRARERASREVLFLKETGMPGDKGNTASRSICPARGAISALGEFPHFFLNTQTACRIWKQAEAFRSTYVDPARGWSTAADLPDVSNAFAPAAQPCQQLPATLHGVVFHIFDRER